MAFNALWQPLVSWAKIRPIWAGYLWLVEKAEASLWLVDITTVSIGWPDFVKMDQSEEPLFSQKFLFCRTLSQSLHHIIGRISLLPVVFLQKHFRFPSWTSCRGEHPVRPQPIHIWCKYGAKKEAASYFSHIWLSITLLPVCRNYTENGQKLLLLCLSTVNVLSKFMTVVSLCLRSHFRSTSSSAQSAFPEATLPT